MPREAYARAAERSSALTAGLPVPLALTLACQRRRGLLTLTCQVAFGGLEGLLAGAGLPVARWFGVPPQPERGLQVAELLGVARLGLAGEVGLRQAGLGVGGDL